MKPRLEKKSTVDLTVRELVALLWYSHGLTTGEVADVEQVSFHTIQRRFVKARQKLQAKTTAEAACNAIRQGLID